MYDSFYHQWPTTDNPESLMFGLNTRKTLQPVCCWSDKVGVGGWGRIVLVTISHDMLSGDPISIPVWVSEDGEGLSLSR